MSSVVAVGGTSPPQLIRAAVVDIQLHPVKKLLFLKFTEKQIRDEVAARLQAGLLWPAFDSTVTGWAMDKPVERIRVLGASPETDEVGIRQVLAQYGEVLDAKKGFISGKKLPGCTNGIWTVRLILGQGRSLPPFLIIKEEGEVWQLATGEISVCWKCGVNGHIGDKCFQDVSALASSLAGPAVSQQPSWAHVVRGAHAAPPHPQPPVLPHPAAAGVLSVPLTAKALVLARSTLLRTLAPVEKPVRDAAGMVISGKVVLEDVELRFEGGDPAVEHAVGRDAGVDANQQKGVNEEENAKFDENNESVECLDENESMEVQTSLNSEVTIDKNDMIETKLVKSSQAVPSSEKRKLKKMKTSNDDSGSDISDSEEVQSMNVDSFDTSKAGLSDSQATSKAGLSFSSQTSLVSEQLKVIVPDEFASDCSTDSSPRRHKSTENRPPVAPPLPGPVIPETCFYFPVVPKALKGMRKCLDKVVKKNDGTIVIIPCKGTQVTELGRESED